MTADNHSTGNATQPRVLFLVKSACANDIRREAQRDRWLKDLPAGSSYYFCVSGTGAVEPHVSGDILHLPGQEGYSQLPAKMKILVAWVAGGSGWNKFDYVVTLDDDIVADITRLFDFLRHEPDHFGNRWDGNPAHISGMFVGYSMAAFKLLSGLIAEIPDRGPEDLLIARAVQEPFRGMNVMTDCDRFKPYGARPGHTTIAVEICPFDPEVMRNFRFSDEPPRRRVSFCLFGDNPKYTQGALENVDLVLRHYSGWEAVFHTRNVAADILAELINRGGSVVECTHANMMLARFLPFREPGIVLSRDCDSRISERETRAVEEWLASDKPAHVIRDHPGHIPGWAMVPGGLWGSRLPFGPKLRQSLALALEDPAYSGWGGDQRWLTENVWRPDGFFIHQYDKVPWMRESWTTDNFCGRQHQASVPPPPKELVVFEGFFNRLNGLVNAYLTHGPQFRVRWSVNAHLPHSFHDIFGTVPGLEISESEKIGYWPENTDPGKGPLCYWFVSRRCGATATDVAAAYRHFLTHLKIPPTPVHGASLGIHFRGLHHSARVKADDFANWCLAQARSRGVTRCFAVADTDRDTITDVLVGGGIEVVWGRSVAMTSDLDRSSLDATKDFLGDALALADCDTVLISFAESTVVDTARAFGREVIAYYGSREWSECWFQHCR